MSDLIEDGYTEEGYIAAEDGIHGPLEFTFRPLLPATRDKLYGFINRDQYEQFHDAAAKTIIRDGNLVEWSLADSKGNPAGRTEQNLKRIKPKLFDKLYAIMAGTRASDRKPDGSGGGKKVDMEGDAKNS